MLIDVIIEDNRWEKLDLPTLTEAAFRVVCSAVDLDVEQSEFAVIACNDARIAELNGTFRGKSEPTNVLSWPAQELATEVPGAAPNRPKPDFVGEFGLGDIAISWDTCARETLAQGKPMRDHVTHLIVHGLLHLLGYDHIRDPDATVMESLETRILGKMGIDDPYREH